jgi:hypothetical protein
LASHSSPWKRFDIALAMGALAPLPPRAPPLLASGATPGANCGDAAAGGSAEKAERMVSASERKGVGFIVAVCMYGEEVTLFA